MKKPEFEMIIVDTTVQEKAIAQHEPDSLLQRLQFVVGGRAQGQKDGGIRPMARRAADGLARLMQLSAQTWAAMQAPVRASIECRRRRMALIRQVLELDS